MAGHERSPRSRRGGPPIDLQVSYRLGPPLIYLKGELDHDTTPYLREVIDEELTPDTKVLVLDFTELAYMDSGGLSLMFDTLQRLEETRRLAIVGANQGVGRLLEITGLAEHPQVSLFPNQKAARAALSSSDPA